MLVKISPVKILSDLGYELVELETPEDYLSALMEAIVSLQGAGGSGRARADILQEELIRVRKERKKAAPSAGMKATKKKINPSKFFDKKEQKSLPMGKGEMGGAIVKVAEGVDSIVETLKEDKKQDKKHFSFLRKMAERFKRRREENKLEFQIFDGLKKTATTLLAPMKSAWQKMLDFIGNVILGRVLFNILEWFGNKENQGKLQSIIKFFKDWWPVMLGGYLLFGNALTSMVTGLLAKIVMWVPQMLLAIGKLMMNPFVAAAVLAGGTALYLSTKKNKPDQNVDQSVEEQGSEATVEDLKQEQIERDEERNPVQKFLFGTVMGEDAERDQQIERVEKMNKGGTVPGSGNTDTVPAMLTPGEFVMSKGAVQKYGVDTLEGLNAAAGGTNRPTLMGGYKGGGGPGFENITNTETTSGPGYYGKRYVSPAEAEERLAAMGMPSMELMDGSIVPDFGKMGADSFMSGIQMVRETIEGHPEKIQELDNFLANNPYAQPDELQRVINSVIPGSQEHYMGELGASITASARMNGGGLVQGFQGGGQVRRVQMGRGAAKKRMEVSKITPIKKKKVTVAYAEEKQNMADKPNTGKSEQEIPSFNVTAMRSPQKIKVLGISV
mgnify:CR=1 FL=1